MTLSRRQFVLTAGVLGIAGIAVTGTAVTSVIGLNRKPAASRYVSAASDSKGNHYVAGVDDFGYLTFRLPIAHRGHHLMTHPTRSELIVFARSPGNIAYVVDYEHGQRIIEINAGNGFHFYGHGVFSADGKFLFTSENNFLNSTGVISVRETDTYQVVSRFSSGGIGPHQLNWLSDEKTLVVANGGLLTHPESGSRVLNLDQMDSSLAYIDSRSGQLVDQHGVDNRLLSIRHLAVANDDTVLVGLQYQGESGDLVPLVAVHNRRQNASSIETVTAPEIDTLAMNHYTASVALDSKSGVAAITCPKGNVLTFWNYKTKEFLQSVPFQECGGAVFDSSRNRFVVSNNYGDFRYFDANTLQELTDQRMTMKGVFWDNHLHGVGLV